MIRINLLPREIYVQDARRQLRFIGVVVLGTVVVLLLGLYGWQLNIKRQEEAKNAGLTAELHKYQVIVDEVADLEQARNLLRARRDVIRQLLVGRLIYPKFFEDFMALLPSEVWVASMNTQLDPTGVMTVTMTAQSLSNFAIADWLDQLAGLAPVLRGSSAPSAPRSRGKGRPPSYPSA